MLDSVVKGFLSRETRTQLMAIRLLEVPFSSSQIIPISREAVGNDNCFDSETE